jgi:hypothetical protein
MDRDDQIVNATTNAAAGALAGFEMAEQIALLEARVHREDGFKPFRVTAEGKIESLEHLRTSAPLRKGEVMFYEALSFARFVNRFKSQSTVIFADRIGVKFTAALDYHPAGEKQDGTSWDLFRGILPLRHTPSWTTWQTANGKPMEQADFAQFLEDNLPDIAEPNGALLVEIARTLEANVDVSYQSHIRAENGAHRFQWLETVTDPPAARTARSTSLRRSRWCCSRSRARSSIRSRRGSGIAWRPTRVKLWF